MSDKILISMKKKITKADIEQALKLTLKMGIHVGGNIILGDPQETEETFKESYDWWISHKEYDISMGFLLAVPDSPVYRYAMLKNLIKNELSFAQNRFPCINLTKMSDKTFENIKRKVSYNTMTLKYFLAGKVLSSKKESNLYKGKNIYTFQVKCPKCSQISFYKYIQFSSHPYSIILCKNCKSRIKIKTRKAFPKEYNAIKGLIIHILYVVYACYFEKYSIYRKIGKTIKKTLKISY